ncbi:MAG TPA: hypothetical protein VNA27_04405 [Rubrobacteraceae bacterium]|nr:hypothetical protein [Rubrobacteraceae bacterium]
MEPAAAKGGAPEIIGEEIVATTEEIVADVKEEAIEAPSRIRQKLRQLAAVWEGAIVRSSASESDVLGSGLAGMYSAKFQALAKDPEQVRPNKR